MKNLLMISIFFSLHQFNTNNVLAQSNIHLEDTSLIKERNSILVSIANIEIKGNNKTRIYIIEREIPFKQGEFMLKSELQKKMELCKQQLMNTALFIDVSVSIDKQENELVFLTIQVKERWYFFPLPYFKLIDRNFNQWWVEQKRSFDRVNYGLKFMQFNFSGRNDNFNLWLVNGYTTQISARYEQPFSDKYLKSGFNVGVSYLKNREINYATINNKQAFIKQDKFVRENFQFNITYSYRPAIKTRHNVKLFYNNDRIIDTVYSLNPDFFSNNLQRISYPELSYNIQYFNVDYIPYPLKGFMIDATILKRGFNKNMNLTQFRFTTSFSKQIFPKAYLLLQAAGSLSLPFNQPYYNKRLFGTTDMYLRGMEYFVIDGVAGIIGRATMQKEIFQFVFHNPLKIKGHENIPFKFYLKAFADMGYAYDKHPSSTTTLNNKWLKTWGVGLDIISIYDFVFRLEYSFNQMGNQGLFVHTKSDF